MKRTNRFLAAVVLLLTFAIISSAQRDDSKFDFYARGPFNENVPRPQSILRFEVGTFHTNYAQMEKVLEKIAAAAPDRVRVYDIGETNEHRMMHVVAISAPENIARIEEIKRNMARLNDPRGLAQAEADALIANTPIPVWLTYTIHGDESASFETMMQVLYQFAASTEADTMTMLKNSIVLINVCANPDGHERFVTWYNSMAVGDPNTRAAEHREPWSVYGRLNHYRFDLNRDNITASQIETRNMQRAFLEWHPLISADHHGQPPQYFFPPVALPINPNLPVDQTARWFTAIGRANASEFDQRNWDYYVRDVFDLFYPGYWDAWPGLNGATGLTYETDGGGFKGLNWRRDDGTIVTLRSAIAKHFIASLTTVRLASENRAARIRDFYDFKRSAIEEGRTGKLKRIVILPGRDTVKAAELVKILLDEGIEVGVARTAFKSTSAHGYLGQPVAAREFPAGAYVIDLAQPQKRLAKALLEPETDQDSGFITDQLARFARNQRRGENASKEEYGFYDLTAWSLPLAFDLESYWTEDASAVDVQPAKEQTAGKTGGVVGGRARVAYVFPYQTDAAAALTYKLLSGGFRVAVASRPLTAGGKLWPRGSLVLRVSRNPDSLHDAIARLAAAAGVEVTAINDGYYESGVTGIGSEEVLALQMPHVAMLADEGIDQTSYGAIWWMFEQYGVSFTPFTVDGLKRSRLEGYNVLVLPDGSPERLYSSLGKGGVELLRSFVEHGGTLVCIKGSAVFATIKDVNLTSSRLVGSEDDDQKPDQPSGKTPALGAAAEKPDEAAKPNDKKSTNKQSAAEKSVDSEDTEKLAGAAPDVPLIVSPSAKPGLVPEALPGTMFRATVDRTHYMTFGYEERYVPVLIASAYFFRPSKAGSNPLMFTAEGGQLKLSGFEWPDNTEKLLRGTSYLIEEPQGSGHVILFAEEPGFRAIWRSTSRLFMNSILFPTAM